MDIKHETFWQAAKASPAVFGAVLSQVTLNEWVAIATLIYVILQAAVLVQKHIWNIQDRKRDKV